MSIVLHLNLANLMRQCVNDLLIYRKVLNNIHGSRFVDKYIYSTAPVLSSTFCLHFAPYQVIGICFLSMDLCICQAGESVCQASTNELSIKYWQVPMNCQSSTCLTVDWYLLHSLLPIWYKYLVHFTDLVVWSLQIIS